MPIDSFAQFFIDWGRDPIQSVREVSYLFFSGKDKKDSTLLCSCGTAGVVANFFRNNRQAFTQKTTYQFSMQWGNFNSIWIRTVFHLRNRLPKYPHCDVTFKNLAEEHSKVMFLIHGNLTNISSKSPEFKESKSRWCHLIRMIWRSHFVPNNKETQRMSFSGDTPCVKADNDIGLLPKIACRAHNQNLWTGNPQRLLSQNVGHNKVLRRRSNE